jgi:hypothetical protein
MRLYFGGRTRLLTLSLLTSAAAALGGCGMFAAADAARGIPVAAQYNGLADKSVAIVVYTMPATIDEFAGSREEISAFVANQMRQHLPTTRLLNPRDVIEWQNGTINWYGLSETDVGKHFSVDRVLSIHVLDYSTRRLIGYSDLQGHLRAQCKIVDRDRRCHLAHGPAARPDANQRKCGAPARARDVRRSAREVLLRPPGAARRPEHARAVIPPAARPLRVPFPPAS